MVANDTLKRSCEKCTKSKVKCEYGSAGCKRCVAKGFICVYRPKRKRGPQDKKSKALKKARNKDYDSNDDSFYSSVSSYERRIWSVFFTIFKHHQRLDSSTWAWCWFAQQLKKVRNHLEVTGNTNSLKMLSTWLEALKLDVISVSNQYHQQCKFNPSLCASCSATALSAPNKQGELYGSLPGVPIVSSREDPSEAEDDANLPVIECFNTGQGSHVIVNEVFTKTFGFRGEEMNKMLEWSGGGFLPWGGDLLARLVVKETDLHEFLQILALKFKSLGSPESKGEGIYEDVSRQVPSVHIFQLWTVGESGEIDSKQSFYMRCLHRECIQNNKMSTQMKIVFKSVGQRVKDAAGQKPVDTEVPKATEAKVHDPKAPLKQRAVVKAEIKAEPEEVAQPKAQEHVHSDHCQHVGSTGTSSYGNVSSSEIKMVDRIPEQLKDYYDWSQDVAYIHGLDDDPEADAVNAMSSSSSLPFEVTQAPPVSSNSEVDMSFLDALMPQESTQNLLSPVMNNASYTSPLDAFVGSYVDAKHPSGWRSIVTDSGALIVSGADTLQSPRWEIRAKYSTLNPLLIEADFSFKGGPMNLGAELQPNGDLRWFDGNVWTRK